jgi:hypothetical protein
MPSGEIYNSQWTTWKYIEMLMKQRYALKGRQHALEVVFRNSGNAIKVKEKQLYLGVVFRNSEN